MVPTYLNLVAPLSLAARRLPLRVNNVARHLHLSQRMIRYLAQKGRLTAFKLDGKSWGFWPDDVDRYAMTMEEHDA